MNPIRTTPCDPDDTRRASSGAASASESSRRASTRNTSPAAVSAHPPVVPLEQLGAHDALELLDLPAQRRLGHLQPGGGPAEVQLLGDGDETAELLQRERHARKVSINAVMDLDRHDWPSYAPLRPGRVTPLTARPLTAARRGDRHDQQPPCAPLGDDRRRTRSGPLARRLRRQRRRRVERRGRGVPRRRPDHHPRRPGPRRQHRPHRPRPRRRGLRRPRRRRSPWRTSPAPTARSPPRSSPARSADGHTLMVFNGSLAYITPLAVGRGRGRRHRRLRGRHRHLAGRLRAGHRARTPASRRSRTSATPAARSSSAPPASAPAASSRQELLFAQAGIDATAVPFDGGSPTLTAVLGGQVDVGSIQLGEAIEQIEAGELTPIVTFAEERPSYLPDTPTAVEAGLRRPGAAVPGGRRAQGHAAGGPRRPCARRSRRRSTPRPTSSSTRTTSSPPNEVDGDELREQWTGNLENYRAVVEQYGIDLGGEQ